MELRRALLCISLALCVTSCERVPPDSTSAVNTNTANTAAAEIVGEHERWRAGTHYEIVQPLLEMTAASGKAKVVEFFWYGCPHCYMMEPHVVLWNRKKPQHVEFERIPTTWGPYDQPHARLFYTLEALGRTDLHAAIFDTIHAQGNRLVADKPQQTRQLQLEFARQHGIDPQQFVNTYDSNVVEVRLQRAERLGKHYQVAKLPTLIVNGKYKTDVSRTGRDREALMRLIGDLTMHQDPEPVVTSAHSEESRRAVEHERIGLPGVGAGSFVLGAVYDVDLPMWDRRETVAAVSVHDLGLTGISRGLVVQPGQVSGPTRPSTAGVSGRRSR